MLEGGVDYSDSSEQRILGILENAGDRSAESDELAAHISDWPSRYHLSRQRANLLRPLQLGDGLRVLEVGAGTGVLSRFLGEQGAEVVALEGQLDRARAAAARCRDLSNVEVVCGALARFEDSEGFDLVCVVGVLEYAGSAAGGAAGHPAFLEGAVELLRPAGAVLLAIENQLGLKYLLGYREDHLGLPWVGVEGYPGSHGIRTFSRAGLRHLLVSCGLPDQHWLYPFPDYKLPTVVLGEALYREPDAVDLVDQLVREPATDDAGSPALLCNARRAHRVMLEAGLGPEVANSFMVVATRDGVKPSILPDRRQLAWRLGDDRRRQWRRQLVVERRDTALAIRSTGPAEDELHDGSGWLRHHPAKDEPYFRGRTIEQTVLEACHRSDKEALRAALSRWRAFVDDQLRLRPDGLGELHPFLPADGDRLLPPSHLDLALSNFVLHQDGIRFIDTEWHAEGGVEPRLAMARSLWLLARDLVLSGSDHPWHDELTVDELTFQLAGLCGLPLTPPLLDRLKMAEVELQHLVTGRDRESLAEDFRWLASRSQTSDDVAAALPLTRHQRQLERRIDRLEEEARLARQREAELERQLSDTRAEEGRLRVAWEQDRSDLESVRNELASTDSRLAELAAELGSARDELASWHHWQQDFERRLPIRVYRAVQRLFSKGDRGATDADDRG
jgi:2-polyprenyl-3-methyl-5-hydroxy-6-metoxy-1,4-benzoquinol methylase